MVAWCVCCPCVPRSCWLQHARGKGAHSVRDPLRFDHAIHHDAAADTVAVALCNNVAHDARRGCRNLQRPRQASSIDMLGVSIDVEITDVSYRPRWAEDLVTYLCRVERPAVVDFAVGIRRALLGAEDAVQTRHSQCSNTDHHQYEERNPQPLQNPQNRKSLRPFPYPAPHQPSSMQLHVGRDTSDGGTSNAVGITG